LNILFIHPNQPAQFEFAACELARNEGNRVVMLSRTNLSIRMPKVELRPFGDGPLPGGGKLPVLQKFNQASSRAIAVARQCAKLKQEGFVPDIIVAHPGWGDALLVKTIFETSPLLNYMEFYNQPRGTDLDFFPGAKRTFQTMAGATTVNAMHALNFFNADCCITPTYWQRSVHPPEMHPRINVLHEGVDIDRCRADIEATFELKDGRILDRECEVVTHVERTFDNYRGFPTFLRAMEIVQQRRPQTHFLIVGVDHEGYSPGSFREQIRKANLDRNRTHFLGHLTYEGYLKVLQLSSAHIYLTAPFVLSWSFLEAMAVACPLACTNTPPVAEVAKDGRDCLMFDFFKPRELADAVDRLLDDRVLAKALGRAARDKVVAEYDRNRLLPIFLQLISDIASGQGAAEAEEMIRKWNLECGREELEWQRSIPLFGTI
jgi:glycosyltransferase involved in cell wall biosynthesis